MTLVVNNSNFESFVFHIPLSYAIAIDRMYNSFDIYRQKLGKEAIFILEHTPVYTIGKSLWQRDGHIKTLNGMCVVCSNRGGGWTFHGPGQVVIYFVYDLALRKSNISQFIATLEKLLIVFFESYCITLQVNTTNGGGRGLWLQGQDNALKKIVFFGLQVKNGVVLHGISINVACDLSFFDAIEPCGMSVGQCTSFLECGYKFDINKLKSELSTYLSYELERSF